MFCFPLHLGSLQYFKAKSKKNSLKGLKIEFDIPKGFTKVFLGAQWLSGRVLDSRPKGRGFEPHRRHCVVVFEQDTFILA